MKDVQSVLERGEDFEKSYATAVHRFPFLIRQNGLQQTLAFYAGKAKAKEEDDQKAEATAEELFLDHILTTLSLHDTGRNHINVIEKLAKTDLQNYMLHTRRCLEMAIWYRRFVESVLNIDATGSSTEQTASKEEKHDGD